MSEDDSKDEVRGEYRFAIIADTKEAGGLKVIDLGARRPTSLGYRYQWDVSSCRESSLRDLEQTRQEDIAEASVRNRFAGWDSVLDNSGQRHGQVFRIQASSDIR